MCGALSQSWFASCAALAGAATRQLCTDEFFESLSRVTAFLEVFPGLFYGPTTSTTAAGRFRPSASCRCRSSSHVRLPEDCLCLGAQRLAAGPLALPILGRCHGLQTIRQPP